MWPRFPRRGGLEGRVFLALCRSQRRRLQGSTVGQSRLPPARSRARAATSGSAGSMGLPVRLGLVRMDAIISSYSGDVSAIFSNNARSSRLKAVVGSSVITRSFPRRRIATSLSRCSRPAAKETARTEELRILASCDEYVSPSSAVNTRIRVRNAEPNVAGCILSAIP